MIDLQTALTKKRLSTKDTAELVLLLFSGELEAELELKEFYNLRDKVLNAESKIIKSDHEGKLNILLTHYQAYNLIVGVKKWVEKYEQQLQGAIYLLTTFLTMVSESEKYIRLYNDVRKEYPKYINLEAEREIKQQKLLTFDEQEDTFLTTYTSIYISQEVIAISNYYIDYICNLLELDRKRILLDEEQTFEYAQVQALHVNVLIMNLQNILSYDKEKLKILNGYVKKIPLQKDYKIEKGKDLDEFNRLIDLQIKVHDHKEEININDVTPMLINYSYLAGMKR